MRNKVAKQLRRQVAAQYVLIPGQRNTMYKAYRRLKKAYMKAKSVLLKPII